MEKTIESSLPVGIWLKVVSFIKFGVATTAASSVVLNNQWFWETLVQATKVLFLKMLQLKVLCWTNTFLAGQTNTNIKPASLCHMTCKKSKRFVRVVANKFKCNSKTNTTVTLTKSSVLWVLRCRLELHLQHLDFALDVDWHSSNVEDARWSTRCTWRRCTGWTARFARSYTVLLSLIAVDQYFGALCNTALL